MEEDLDPLYMDILEAGMQTIEIKGLRKFPNFNEKQFIDDLVTGYREISYLDGQLMLLEAGAENGIGVFKLEAMAKEFKEFRTF